MGKAVAVAASCAPTPLEGVRDALRERIGDERFSVWFGDASWAATVAEGKTTIVIRAGGGVTHEWLRRTFKADVDAVVRAVCGARGLVAYACNERHGTHGHEGKQSEREGKRSGHRSRI